MFALATMSAVTCDGLVLAILSPIPIWTVVLIVATVPAIWIGLKVRKRLARRRSQRIGRCKNCGYDIRATQEKCPECGAVPGMAMLFSVINAPRASAASRRRRRRLRNLLRIGRWCFDATAAASLLICITAALMWAQSIGRRGGAGAAKWQPWGDRGICHVAWLDVKNGCLTFGYGTMDCGYPDLYIDMQGFYRSGGLAVHLPGDGVVTYTCDDRFQFGQSPFNTPGLSTAIFRITVPLWFVALLATVCPAIWTSLLIRRHRGPRQSQTAL